jgi:4-amino-4-deoxy-L-arabinose transferase-like glycosyltransferase
MNMSGEAEQRVEAANRAGGLIFAFVGYLLVIFILVSVSSFVQKSPTNDEPLHLFAGYSYLKWHDFRTNPEHPPLAKMWAALPLLALNITDPRPGRPHWNLMVENRRIAQEVRIDRDMFFDNDAKTLFFFAKLQMIGLAVLLGLFVYLWSKELFGVEAALAALFLFALDPNILAHSNIVHTDVPFATFAFIATYFFWRYLKRANWPNLLFFCLCSGLAAVTKYSYPALLIIWLILGTLRIFQPAPQIDAFAAPRIIASRRGKTLLTGGAILAAGFVTYLFIWAVYGFRFNAVPDGSAHFDMDSVISSESFFRPLVLFATDHHLFPEAWIYGQLYVLTNLHRMAYLFGEPSPEGSWTYFLVAFAVKTPLPTLILLAIGCWMIIRRRVDGTRFRFVLIPALLYFAFAVIARINIGVRHILFVYPFLFVFAGAVVTKIWRSKAMYKRTGLMLLAGWYVAGCFWIYPHYLAYFNEVIGGPKNGHNVLVNSNIDWGQDLPGLKKWMDANKVKKIRLLYAGALEPEYYGIDAEYLPGSRNVGTAPETSSPEITVYTAVSAEYLFGPEELQFDEAEREQLEPVKRLRFKKPVATIGYSIFIFEDEGKRK